MNFLDIDLTPEDQKELSNILTEWKATELEKMSQALQEAKDNEINKIEESLVEYKQQLEEDYLDKVNVIIESLKPQIRKQVLVEMNETNPEMLVMEKIKEMMFPLVNESGASYTNEINLLKKELDELKQKNALSEGEAKKEKLLEGYSEKTRAIIDKMIGEGNAIEITEKYYEIIESFQELEEDDPIVEETEKVLDENTEITEEESKEDVDIIDEDFEPTVETNTIDEETKRQEESKVVNPIKSAILESLKS
jgi:hypothetical protein